MVVESVGLDTLYARSDDTLAQEGQVTYYRDFSPYRYLRSARRRRTVNIGWLDRPRCFPQGPLDPGVIERIWNYCTHSVLETRGGHCCTWCPRGAEQPLLVQYNGVTLELGVAEIRVFGQASTIYAAPNLIYHYIVSHQYRPPDAFVSAVLHGPQPRTAEYNVLLHQYGWT